MYFVIAANPGEALKPLSKVASGGELSRIMLAIRTVTANQDDIGTLIFDEIDAGISGRTAQRVAAMADVHFMIEKSVQDNKTVTSIYRLLDTQCVEELARLLGGSTITEAVRANAQELCHQAAAYKNK